MSKPEVKVIQESEQNESLKDRRSKLVKLLALSGVLDLILSGISVPFLPFGGPIVEEIVEYFVSQTIASMTDNLELSSTDKMIGLLPIPGVTAMTVRCFREILSINKELNKAT